MSNNGMLERTKKHRFNGGLNLPNSSSFAKQMNGRPISLSERVGKILQGVDTRSAMTSTPPAKRGAPSSIPSPRLPCIRAFEILAASDSSSTVADSIFGGGVDERDADDEEDEEYDDDDVMQIDDDTPSLLEAGDGTTLDEEDSFSMQSPFITSFAKHARAFACNGDLHSSPSSPSANHQPSRALFGLGFSGMFNSNLNDGTMSSELGLPEYPFAMDISSSSSSSSSPSKPRNEDLDVEMDSLDIDLEHMEISEAYSYEGVRAGVLVKEDASTNAPRIPQWTMPLAPTNVDDLFSAAHHFQKERHQRESSFVCSSSTLSEYPPAHALVSTPSRPIEMARSFADVAGTTISSALKRKSKRKPVYSGSGDAPKWKL